MSEPNYCPSLLVACLCAQWCGVCCDYRSTFEQVATGFPAMRFMWVDIEDEAALMDPVEVENFPTLLIAAQDGVRFFGTLTPHKETLMRLLRAQTESPAGAALPGDAQVQALAQRLSMR
jgi:thioredoxin 1